MVLLMCRITSAVAGRFRGRFIVGFRWVEINNALLWLADPFLRESLSLPRHSVPCRILLKAALQDNRKLVQLRASDQHVLQ